MEVVAVGPLSTVQDLGRPGLAHLGVGPSGAADRDAFRLANRLVGNDESAAGIEATLGGLRVRAREDLIAAVTGAWCPITVDGRAEPPNSVLRVRAGAEVHLGVPERGLRSYLAVRGGLATEPVLGSCATDVLSGIGPAPLTPGTVLPIGAPPDRFPLVDLAPMSSSPSEEIELRVRFGPRDDWFTDDALSALISQPFEVTTDSNRIGMRLDGPALPRGRTEELASEGLVPGALQVPPTSKTNLFLADHPMTGGYPVIAVVHSADLGLAAQARPGQRIRFRLGDPPGQVR